MAHQWSKIWYTTILHTLIHEHEYRSFTKYPPSKLHSKSSPSLDDFFKFSRVFIVYEHYSQTIKTTRSCGDTMAFAGEEHFHIQNNQFMRVVNSKKSNDTRRASCTYCLQLNESSEVICFLTKTASITGTYFLTWRTYIRVITFVHKFVQRRMKKRITKFIYIANRYITEDSELHLPGDEIRWTGVWWNHFTTSNVLIIV